MNKEQQQTYIWIAYSLFQWLKAFAFASMLIGIVLTNFNVVAFALFFMVCHLFGIGLNMIIFKMLN